MPKNAKNGQKCKNPKSGQLKIDPCSSPIPTPTQKIAQKSAKKTIVCKEKSGWVKIHQKSTKKQIILKKLGKIFLNLTFLNVLIKSFPKMYDTCRGLFFRPRISSGSGCSGLQSCEWDIIWYFYQSQLNQTSLYCISINITQLFMGPLNIPFMFIYIIVDI